jgi:hypothetical protein
MLGCCVYGKVLGSLRNSSAQAGRYLQGKRKRKKRSNKNQGGEIRKITE